VEDGNDTREVLALLASRDMRCGPDSAMARFLRLFEPFIREVWQPEILVLEGTYRSMLRCGLLHDYPFVRPVTAGRLGGLVALSQRVVAGLEDGRRLDCVVYFLDPRDATSMFPDSQALKRECVVTRTPFLATECAAESWLLPRWQMASDDPGCRDWFVYESAEETLFAGEHDDQDALALIAHDALKRDMLAFAEQHFDFLDGFSRRLATGTTGALLNGEVPERLEARWREERAQAEALDVLGVESEALRRTLADAEATRDLSKALGEHHGGDWVTTMASGPRGGDVEVAELVRRGVCRNVVFFEDPHVSREHEADIQLLERATRIPGREAVCLHDPKTAARWAHGIDACRRAGLERRLPLVAAFRRYWGADLVAVDDPASSRQVVDAAAWYVWSLLAERTARCAAAGWRLGVVVGPGGAARDAVEAIGGIPGVLAALQRRHTGLSETLLPAAVERPACCDIVPALGLVGARDASLEANHGAQRLARFTGGRASSLSTFAFTADGSADPVSGEIRSVWEGAGVALIGCGPLTGDERRAAGLPVPPALDSAFDGLCAGQVAGICVDAEGLEAPTGAYARAGIELEALRRLAARGGSVLIADEDQGSLPAALAALRGGLVSVLVAGRDTARRIIAAETAAEESSV